MGSAGAGSPYGSYAEDAYTVKENNTEVLATYIKQLNKNWGIDALLGFNVRNKQYENNYQAAPRLAVADLYTLTNSRDPLISSNDFYRLRQYTLRFHTTGLPSLGFLEYNRTERLVVYTTCGQQFLFLSFGDG